MRTDLALYEPNHLPGVVYIAASDDEKRPSRVKIGYTMFLHERMRRLKCRPLMTISAGPDVERILHRLFKDYRLDGEWFSLSGDLTALLHEMQGRGEQRVWAA